MSGPTWLGLRCVCGHVTPVVSAVPYGGACWRNPRMRLPDFTEKHRGIVGAIVADGISCGPCGRTFPATAPLRWTQPPVDALLLATTGEEN